MYRDLYQALIQMTKQDEGITLIGKREEEYISYKTLWEKSRYICNLLKRLGAYKGCEVVIQCKDVKNFMYSFWGCVIGGFIAVPLDTSSNEYRSEINNKVFKRLNDPFLLFDDKENDNQKALRFKGKSLNLQEVNYNSKEIINLMDQDENSDPEDTVYIQFSSGSTGEPRGAALSKMNISTNVQDIIERMSMSSEDKIMSWQPLTHCYGLIVFHILPIILGTSQKLILIDAYIHSPLIWMEKANEYKITRLGTIPFALKHFMDVHENCNTPFSWDLSCIKSITIGGEHVTNELCEKFVDMMKKYKVDKNVMKPIYGLAESTTCVSILGLEDTIDIYNISRDQFEIGKTVSLAVNENSDKGISFVGSGRPLENVETKIVDDENNTLPDSTMGYLYVRGKNVTSGYYNNELDTKEAFLPNGWFDTGDIGFKLDGKIVVVSRKKELIVVNGKKYTCIDIENIINRKVDAKEFGQVIVCNGLDTEKKSEQAIVFVKTLMDLKNIQKMKDFLELSSRIKEVVFETSGLVIDNIIPIDNIPKTYSGKIRRKELTNSFNAGDFTDVLNEFGNLEKNMANETLGINEDLSKNQVRKIIVNIIENMFKINVTDFDLAFNNYGIVSVNIPPFIERINNTFNINIKVSAFFNNPNINKFADYIYIIKNKEKGRKDSKVMDNNEKNNNDKIAIVGMSCRFPGGSNSIDEYWEVLMNGVDGICDVPENRWNLEKYYDQDENVPGKMYCKKGGFLDVSVDEFDARFFNISPKEAAALDPQQRLLLEMTWEAFENADIDITKYSGTNTGVYVGMSTTEYSLSNLYSGNLTNIDAYSLTGTCMSTACGRISYTFGFEGPCIAVDTACSSALTSLHLACTAIKAGQMDVGVVGGINLMLSPSPNIGFSKLHATSRDGHSKAFDASADGYGRGEGCGVIIIKKLADAIRDNDNILGVICGSGINQDGKSNGLAAPNGAAQAKLIESTLASAKLSPLDIDYIEMHGTGTKLGDPIEVGAIVETYGKERDINNLLKIGSVKSNIGHLEAAAGIASIAKVLLSLKHKVIPGNLNFNTPNPFINWSESPITVINEHTKWENEHNLRRAGINGFGFGGSNAHIIIEEYKPDKQERQENEEKQGINYILKVSTKSEKSLNEQIKKYAELVKKCDDNAFGDLVYSADRGRADFEYRFAVVGSTKEQILQRMESFIQGEEPEGVFTSFGDKNIFRKERKLAFMFTGQGSQYVNMGKSLYETKEVFRNTMIQCDKLFKPLILKSVIDLLYGENTSTEIIEKTVYAQPLIFSIEYALYKLWASYGVKPEIVMGHSIGEYVAAVASEIMSLEDAVKLVSIRGRLMDSAPGTGSMGTIFASEDIVTKMIEEYRDVVSIAAINAEETCVISGESKVVEELLGIAEEKGIRVRMLKVSHGFHSQLMSPILGEFEEIAKEVEFRTPKIRLVSAVYAKEIGEKQLLDASYWTKHIREKVDFYKAVTSLDDAEDYVLLEVGSTRVLAALCKLIFGDEKIIAGTLNRKKDDAEQLAETISQIYVAGVNVDWNNIEFFGKKNWERISLPNYPFERTRYWNELLYDRVGANIDDTECHKFLGQKIESPFMQDSIIFQSKFTGENPYFMKEHIIFDTPISPAAAHISMMLSAVKEVENPLSCTLREIEFRAPLAVNEDEERQVQVCINRSEKSKGKFSIVSRDKENVGSKWLTHSQSEFTVSNKYYESETPFNIDEFENKEFTVDPEKGVYDAMRNAGFELGDSFRRIKRVAVGEDECTCFITPLNTVPNLDMYVLYPGVIDSIIQSGLNAVLDELYNTYGENTPDHIRTTIPYYIEKLTYNYRQSNNLWCHTLSKIKDDMLYAQVTVFNENGEDIMKIENCMVKLTNRESLLREMKNNYSKMYYHTEWFEENGIDIKNSDITAQQYIVVADDEKIGKDICTKLSKNNIDVKLVLQGKTMEELDDDLYCINIRDKEDWLKLLQTIIEDSVKSEFKFIYLNMLENDELSENIDIEGANLERLKGLLYLTQAINDKNLNKKVKVKIVTKKVQNINNEMNYNISQSPLWGYSKVFGLEFPQVFAGIVDIDDTCLLNGTDNLLSEIMREEAEEVCLRGENERYVSRLIKHSEYVKKGRKKVNKIEIIEDGSYLITGGTGSIGMVYAEYFVNHGAKNLILVCRNEPKEKVYMKINEFKTQGVNVELVYADVCNKESIESALSKFNNIRGVVHAAGTLRDKMLAEQTWEDFEAVLNPKVYGTVNVYNALNKENLDFFMMLSSITSVVGNMGQCNYAAANYFMNNFAAKISAEKPQGFTFCWGPWKDGGMALANDTTAKNMANFGICAFESETGRKIIEEFFEQPYENIMIADIDWKTYGESISVDRKILSKVLKDGFENNSTDKNNNEKSVVDELKPLTNGERKEFLVEKLQFVCGKIMGFEKGQPLAIDTSFKEQGADSLMIFSMRASVNKLLNTDINVADFFNYPTLIKIVDYLVDEVLFVDEEVEISQDGEEISVEDLLSELTNLAE